MSFSDIRISKTGVQRMREQQLTQICYYHCEIEVKQDVVLCQTLHNMEVDWTSLQLNKEKG